MPTLRKLAYCAQSCRMLRTFRTNWFPLGSSALFLNAVSKFLDHRICQNLAGNALHLRLSISGREAVGQRKREILALADARYAGKSDLAQSILDGLPLWIEDRRFQRDIDMSLHHP